jgi:DNA-binding GntR family transcriptional regulator
MRHVEIYQSLRKDILTCRLPPGAELREQELAQQFEVSKSPVRDALQHLVRERLVTVMPRQGYRVSPVSMSDAHDMFAFRQVLELACIAEAARSASDEQLKALDRFRTFAGDSSDDFIAYNRDFHCALARCSGNGRMSRAACDLIEEMDRVVRMSVAAAARDRDPQKLVKEHAQIIDALQAREAKLAVRLLKSHTVAAEKRFITALEWAALQI